MDFEYVKAGHIVDGPSAGGFVPLGEDVEAVIKTIAEEAGDDPDDYTATPAYIKQFRGSVFESERPT